MENPENSEVSKKVKLPLERFYDSSYKYKYEISIDECGRGPLFGRVYVGCVVLPKDPEMFDGKDIKDSKKFTSKKKLKDVAEYIKTHALAWHVSWVDEKVIDEINILQANMRGMHNGISEILKKLPADVLVSNCLAVIDGNYFTPYRCFDSGSETLVEMPHATVEKGDAKYMGIAAASILAKAARDEYILELCQEHPILVERYKLNTNMGYGTKPHMDGIREHGITQWHRRTFGEACKKAKINEI